MALKKNRKDNHSGYKILKGLKYHHFKLQTDYLSYSFVSKLPTIRFYPNTSKCPYCGQKLSVHKTQTKTAVSINIGTFKAHETLLVCKSCHNERIYSSEDLLRLIPHRCNFGFDVLVFVGTAMFTHCRNEEEIRCELKKTRNITISTNEISYLAKKFIIYLAIVHEDSCAKLKHFLHLNGGYILHLDATCEGDSPHLMIGLDGNTGIILENIKLPSEKSDSIIPFLRQIKAKFGTPLASVHDMGAGICLAVKTVFPDIYDYICHFHFLRDIGKDLFSNENDKLRLKLRKYGIQGKLRKRARELLKTIDCIEHHADVLIRCLEKNNPHDNSGESIAMISIYSLIIWALDGKNQGDGYGFPFDQPYLSFYQRIRKLYFMLLEIKDNRRDKDSPKVFTTHIKVMKELGRVVNDQALYKISVQMEEKIKVFDKLRSAMRITIPGSNTGLNDSGKQVKMKTIKKRVTQFRDQICNEKSYTTNKSNQKMIVQIEKYWDKLFADPIVVEKGSKRLTVYPQRTNNILEGLFRDFKRRIRKKSGNNNLTKTLQTMLADTPFVKNLENQDYLNILLDGKENLEERFSEISTTLVKKKLQTQQNDCSRLIAPKFKKLIKKNNFLISIRDLMTS